MLVSLAGVTINIEFSIVGQYSHLLLVSKPRVHPTESENCKVFVNAMNLNKILMSNYLPRWG